MPHDETSCYLSFMHQLAFFLLLGTLSHPAEKTRGEGRAGERLEDGATGKAPTVTQLLQKPQCAFVSCSQTAAAR